MTSTTPSGGATGIRGAAASFSEAGDVILLTTADPYEGLKKLLPKLVHPSWHKHAHSGMYHENRHRHEADSVAVAKAKRRTERRQSRLLRALAGERTRVTRLVIRAA